MTVPSVDGIWVSQDPAPVPPGETSFWQPSPGGGDAIRHAILRLDCLDPGALGVCSGQARLTSGRVEEFRAEANAIAIGADAHADAVATTRHPRIFYRVRFHVDHVRMHLHASLQRLQLSAGLGSQSAPGEGRTVVAGAVFEAVCRRRVAGRFRELELDCRVDPAVADSEHLTSLLDAFACGGAMAASIGSVRSPRDTAGTCSVEAALGKAGLATTTRVRAADRPGVGDDRLRAVVRKLRREPASDRAALVEMLAWSTADLDALIQTAVAPADRPDDPAAPMAGVLVVAPRFADRPGIVGTMFSTARQPRRGCALFVDPAGDGAWTGGARTRALRFCAVHELGHLLNLLHCFEADHTEHRRQRRQPEAATFMNYPNRFPFGTVTEPGAEDACRSLFWSRFDQRFGPDELAHLRHGWDAVVRPGQAIEALMSAARAPVVAGGVAEAAAEAFPLESLRVTDTGLFDWLRDDPAEEAPRWRLRLPEQLVLGEPVVGWVQVHNATSTPQLVPDDLDPAAGLLAVEIAHGAREPERFRPARSDCGAGASWLAPGAGRCQAIQLRLCWRVKFTNPGRYRITLRATFGNEDRLAAHDLVVTSPASGGGGAVELLFGDERLGLALVGEGAAPADQMDALLAMSASSIPRLDALLSRQRARRTFAAAQTRDEIEAGATRLHGAIIADARADLGGFLRLHHARELRELAVDLLRRQALPDAAAARLAGRSARSARTILHGLPDTTGRARRAATAVLRVAEQLAA